jgi:hypothetical protein
MCQYLLTTQLFFITERRANEESNARRFDGGIVAAVLVCEVHAGVCEGSVPADQDAARLPSA